MPARLPEAWADVATKDDLRNLEERLNLRIENSQRYLLEQVHQEIASLAKTIYMAALWAFAVASWVFAFSVS